MLWPLAQFLFACNYDYQHSCGSFSMHVCLCFDMNTREKPDDLIYKSGISAHAASHWKQNTPGADLGVGPEGHRPVEIWLAPEVPLSFQSSLIYIKLAASVRRLKINLLNGFCLQLLVLCFQSRSSSPLREVPIQNFKVKKHIMVDVIEVLFL